MPYLDNHETRKETFQIFDPDIAIADLYKSGRRWMYAGVLLLAVGLCMLLPVLYPALMNNGEQSPALNNNQKKLSPVSENGRFLPAHEVYGRMRDNILTHTGNEYLTNIDGEGGLGFYKRGEASYTFSIACLDKNHEYLEFDEQEIPDRIIIYDYSGDLGDKEYLSIYLQSFFDSLSPEEVSESMRNLKEESEKLISSKEAKGVTAIEIKGSLFYLFPAGKQDQQALAVIWDSLNYIENQDPALIQNRLTSSGRYVSANCQDAFSAHQCIICGKKASYRLKWVNKAWEWYCREHWDELTEKKEKLLGE